jgi:hypothetical protein
VSTRFDLVDTLPAAMQVRKQSTTVSPSSPLVFTQGSARMTVPPAVLSELSSHLCNSEVGVKSVSWSKNKHGCIQPTNLTAASESTQAARDSPTSTFELASSCGNSSAVRVADLSVPILLELPLSRRAIENSVRSFACRQGQRYRVELECDTSGEAVRTNITCDGRSDYLAPYACAPRVRCIFWNASRRAWSDDGCRVRRVTNSTVQCECTHLTDFSTSADSLGYFLTTVERYKELDRDYVEANMGILITLGAIYGAFLTGLIFIRVKRAQDSLQYRKVVKNAKCYKAVLKWLAREAKSETSDSQALQVTAEGDEDETGGGTNKKRGALSKTEKDNTAKKIFRMAVMGQEGFELKDMAAEAAKYRLKKLRNLVNNRLEWVDNLLGRVGMGKGDAKPKEDAAASTLLMSGRHLYSQLSLQQSFLVGFLKLLTLLALAIITQGPNPESLWLQAQKMLRESITATFFVDMFITSFQQSILTEPITQIIEGLLFSESPTPERTVPLNP